MADYVLEGPSWGANPVITWSVADANYASRPFQFSSFLNSDFLSDITAAFAKWASVANITFEEVPDTANSDIRLGLNQIDGPANVVGDTETVSSTRSDSTIEPFVSADIKFDADEEWSDRGGHMVSSTNMPLYPVALHEIGHALGLDHYTDGTAIMNPVISADDLTQSDVDGIQALYGPPVPSTDSNASAESAGPTYASSSMDVFRNQKQPFATFVFTPGYGHDVVGGFVVAGAGHSTLDLPSSDFASLADVLRHTQAVSHGALIHDPVSGDTIGLLGISKAQLLEHRQQDFALHASSTG